MPETLQPQTRKFFTIFLYPVLSSRKLLKCHLTAQKRGQYFFVPKQVVLEKIKQRFPVHTYLLKAAASVHFFVLFYTCFTVTTKRFLRGSNFVTAQHGRDCVQSSIFFLHSEARQETLQSKHMSHNFFCLPIFKCHFTALCKDL